MDKNDIVDIISAAIAAARTGSDTQVPSPQRQINMAATSSLSAEAKSYKSGFFTKQEYIKPYKSTQGGRPFISEYDVKQMLKQNPREITVPENAIISPLAMEIIQEKNIHIKRK